ncbi:MAG: flavodoxin-dependent (E)-4-hydroxy-3-methylbut-2-enyl-diphosphate synthase [Bacillota bacterium]|nr:flavodoxin-dependent (E)-4-hydroxy-3-methylbut-2-enyl-diphosphate synthase [Bacillota bacterium]
MFRREETKQVKVGPVTIGGGAPISVQSMTNTETRDVGATVAQIRRLAAAGCELVRVAVPDQEAAEALGRIVALSPLPVVADIHFDYRLALRAIEQGVAKVRINPGNIGSREKVREVVRAASAAGIPLRIGVNAGSLAKRLKEAHGGATPEAMVASAAEQIELLEELGFSDIVVSLKASDVPRTVEAYRLFAERFAYPLHLGITEAGLPPEGLVRSAVGLGILLAEGLGDTVRVSLTGDPVAEVRAAYAILGALHLRRRGPEVIACPTCGRCQVDLTALAEEVSRRVASFPEPVRIAVMGCAVNGPGEAAEADLGVAGGKKEGLIFRGGKPVRKVPQEALVEALMEELELWRQEKKAQERQGEVSE